MTNYFEQVERYLTSEASDGKIPASSLSDTFIRDNTGEGQDSYEIQKNGTDGEGIINFKTR